MSSDLVLTTIEKSESNALFFGANLLSYAMMLEIVGGFRNLENERATALELGNLELVAELDRVMKASEKTMETSDFWNSDFTGQA
jgi:hypothetical protein